MRVARTTTNAKAAGARRRGGGDGRGFEPAERAETGAAAVAGGGVLGSIDALTALQGVGGADAAESAAAAATARGTALLDDLDALRDELLAGAVDDTTLARLRDRLGERRRGRLDAGLEAILDDIELRAAVELAKREPAAPGSAAPRVEAGGPAPADAAARARRAYGVGADG
jgi:hypothetical protein